MGSSRSKGSSEDGQSVLSPQESQHVQQPFKRILAFRPRLANTKRRGRQRGEASVRVAANKITKNNKIIKRITT
jgi:hypothetical protein